MEKCGIVMTGGLGDTELFSSRDVVDCEAFLIPLSMLILFLLFPLTFLFIFCLLNPKTVR